MNALADNFSVVLFPFAELCAQLQKFVTELCFPLSCLVLILCFEFLKCLFQLFVLLFKFGFNFFQQIFGLFLLKFFPLLVLLDLVRSFRHVLIEIPQFTDPGLDEPMPFSKQLDGDWLRGVGGLNSMKIIIKRPQVPGFNLWICQQGGWLILFIVLCFWLRLAGLGLGLVVKRCHAAGVPAGNIGSRDGVGSTGRDGVAAALSHSYIILILTNNRITGFETICQMYINLMWETFISLLCLLLGHQQAVKSIDTRNSMSYKNSSKGLQKHQEPIKNQSNVADCQPNPHENNSLAISKPVVKHIYIKQAREGKRPIYLVQWVGHRNHDWVEEADIPPSILQRFNNEVIDLQSDSEQKSDHPNGLQSSQREYHSRTSVKTIQKHENRHKNEKPIYEKIKPDTCSIKMPIYISLDSSSSLSVDIACLRKQQQPIIKNRGEIQSLKLGKKQEKPLLFSQQEQQKKRLTRSIGVRNRGRLSTRSVKKNPLYSKKQYELAKKPSNKRKKINKKQKLKQITKVELPIKQTPSRCRKELINSNVQKNQPLLSQKKGFKRPKLYGQIVRLQNRNGDGSDVEYFYLSETEKSSEEEQYVKKVKSSSSGQNSLKPGKKNKKKNPKEKDEESSSGSKIIDSLKADATIWQQHQNSLINYVSNTFLMDGDKYFTLKLHHQGQNVVVSQETMIKMFPRKLAAFYEEVIRQTVLSTASNFGPF